MSYSRFGDNKATSNPSITPATEQFAKELQQLEMENMGRMMILSLSQKAFAECVTKPSSSLGWSEKTCIEQFSGRTMEALMIINQKIQGSTQG